MCVWARFSGGGYPTPLARGTERFSSGNVDELLGGVTLDQKVAVIQGFEVNFDDVCAGVVDPHAHDRMSHY